MAFSLDRVLKALLFGASGPLSVKEIQGVFTKYHAAREVPEGEEVEENPDYEEPEQPFLPGDGMPTTEVPDLVTATQIRESMDRIAAEMIDKDEVYRLIERPSGFLMVTSPTVGEWISLLRDEPRPIKLNQSALETLAVIAYRQPVVRAEIEKIRGVSIDSPLSKLLERDFVHVVGRADLPGRPIQYGTTEAFLEFVGIRSIEELPASDVLSPGQLDEWLHEVSNQQEMTEKEMGLPEGDKKEAAVGQSEESEEESADTDEEAAEAETQEAASEEVVEEEAEIEADEEGEENLSAEEELSEEPEEETEEEVKPVE
ncbi:SMC-Scp complex subunit ScpB [Pelagicoccus enzymogenes]|uniref:SMC-Scp complex subunit ScpB n=1 Tax=Pelagicoccus enzymogenes TaxID=2773457 RepID=UPI00280CD050|nr:SMC-Scp complex subunit ScpB [Pelagicoccus enzymogenes]MDQ8198086.1 SMC-Scp complex subunit ScpB [Pelagicoccus enzymogenes]